MADDKREKLAERLEEKADEIEREARFPCGAGFLVDNLVRNKAIGYRDAARMVREARAQKKPFESDRIDLTFSRTSVAWLLALARKANEETKLGLGIMVALEHALRDYDAAAKLTCPWATGEEEKAPAGAQAGYHYTVAETNRRTAEASGGTFVVDFPCPECEGTEWKVKNRG